MGWLNCYLMGREHRKSLPFVISRLHSKFKCQAMTVLVSFEGDEEWKISKSICMSQRNQNLFCARLNNTTRSGNKKYCRITLYNDSHSLSTKFIVCINFRNNKLLLVILKLRFANFSCCAYQIETDFLITYC